MDSNLGTRLGRGRSGRCIVRCWVSLIGADAEGTWAGALNWATGETVAVKEIQLSNIPKAELGEIMVRDLLHSLWFMALTISPV